VGLTLRPLNSDLMEKNGAEQPSTGGAQKVRATALTKNPKRKDATHPPVSHGVREIARGKG